MTTTQEQETQESESQGPVGQGDHVVAPGECMNSIAAKYGFFWETLWDHPDNAELKRARKDHNVLLPGDRVHVPDLREKQESGASEKKHRFRRKGVPSKLKLQLLKDGSAEPYANKRYVLDVDGELTEGTVDGEGNIELPMNPGARNATLRVGDGDEQEVFELGVGGLDPVESASGAQQRLINLGLLEGEAKDRWDEASLTALRRFQSLHVLQSEDETPSGVYDERTQQKLLEIHKC